MFIRGLIKPFAIMIAFYFIGAQIARALEFRGHSLQPHLHEVAANP